MGLQDLASGDDPVLSALLNFNALSGVIQEMAASLLAQEKRNEQLERNYENRIEHLEKSYNASVRLNQDLQDRFSQLEKDTESNMKRFRDRVDHLELQARNTESAVSEIKTSIERRQAQRMQFLSSGVGRVVGQSEGGTGKDGADGEGSGGVGEALINAHDLQGIFDSLGRLADVAQEHTNQIKDLEAHLDTIREHLDDTDTNLLNKASKGDLTDVWTAVHAKADMRKTARMLEELDVKLTQTTVEAKRLTKTTEHMELSLNEKADRKQVDAKADKDEVEAQLSQKLGRQQFEGVEKRVSQMKNNLQLTSTMIDNLRKVVDDTSENMNNNNNLVELLKKQVYQKADLHYTDNAVAQLQRKFKNHDKAIREICRTKADVADLEAIQGPLQSMMEGDDAFLAAGKLHYRCLSCDRLGQSLTGAMTDRFRQATSPRKENRPAVNQLVPSDAKSTVSSVSGTGALQPHPPTAQVRTSSASAAGPGPATDASVFGIDGRVYHGTGATVTAHVLSRRPQTAGANNGTGPLWIP